MFDIGDFSEKWHITLLWSTTSFRPERHTIVSDSDAHFVAGYRGIELTIQTFPITKIVTFSQVAASTHRFFSYFRTHTRTHFRFPRFAFLFGSANQFNRYFPIAITLKASQLDSCSAEWTLNFFLFRRYRLATAKETTPRPWWRGREKAREVWKKQIKL